MGKYKAFYEALQVSMSSINPAATNPTLTVNIFATVATFFVMTMTSVSHTGTCAGGCGLEVQHCTVGKHSEVRLTLQPGHCRHPHHLHTYIIFTFPGQAGLLGLGPTLILFPTVEISAHLVC